MFSKTLTAPFCLLVLSCHQDNSLQNNTVRETRPLPGKTNPYPYINSIPVPGNFTRLEADSNSFAGWLRKRGLKKDKTVYLYNGDKKQNQQAQFAVLDISVGKKDLQQCADAIMRLRAEYLFDTKQFSRIRFTDNENKSYQFLPPYTKDNLLSFMQRVFGMCGSASLSKQLLKKDINNIHPGDVFIHGGFPGHAEIVMDVAVNKEGKKIFMLAQSYMPAQDIHVLVNPVNEELSPWYETGDNIISPEYSFTKSELKSWE